MRRPAPYALAGVLLVLAPATGAAADDTPPDGPAGRDATAAGSAPYIWQLLALDVSAAALVGAGLLQDEPALIWPGIGLYLAGGPTLHLGYAKPDDAEISLLLRIVAPALLGMAGGTVAYIDDSRDDGEVLTHAAPGLITGALLAIIVDSVILEARRPDGAASASGEGRAVVVVGDGLWLHARF